VRKYVPDIIRDMSEEFSNISLKKVPEEEEKKTTKIGRGKKICKECKEIIASRNRVCPKCNAISLISYDSINNSFTIQE